MCALCTPSPRRHIQMENSANRLRYKGKKNLLHGKATDKEKDITKGLMNKSPNGFEQNANDF